MKLKILISNRTNGKIVINGVPGDTLPEISMYIKEKQEAFKFFDREFFDIRIKEDFGSNAAKDTYNACLKEVRSSDFIIALYNGVARFDTNPTVSIRFNVHHYPNKPEAMN